MLRSDQIAQAFAQVLDTPSQHEPPSPHGPEDYGLPAAHEAIEQKIQLLTELPLSIEDWRTRDLPEPDFILGNWLSTTSRVLISASTAIGKSNLAIPLGHIIASR